MAEEKEFKKGAEFQNVMATTDSPPTQDEKGNVHKSTKDCVFYSEGKYEGLNHVVPIHSPVKIGISSPVYLAPGCASCNRRYADTLIL